MTATRARALVVGLVAFALLINLFFVLIERFTLWGVPTATGHARSPAVRVSASTTPIPLMAAVPSPSATFPSPTASAAPVPTNASELAVTAPSVAGIPSNPSQEMVPILFEESGQGNATTSDFQLPTQWLLYWTYVCNPPASASATLKVAVYRKGIDVPLKTIANENRSTSGVEHNYVGDGWYHLWVESPCTWRLTVTPAAGSSLSPTPSP